MTSWPFIHSERVVGITPAIVVFAPVPVRFTSLYVPMYLLGITFPSRNHVQIMVHIFIYLKKEFARLYVNGSYFVISGTFSLHFRRGSLPRRYLCNDVK